MCHLQGQNKGFVPGFLLLGPQVHSLQSAHQHLSLPSGKDIGTSSTASCDMSHPPSPSFSKLGFPEFLFYTCWHNLQWQHLLRVCNAVCLFVKVQRHDNNKRYLFFKRDPSGKIKTRSFSCWLPSTLSYIHSHTNCLLSSITFLLVC